MDNKTDKPKVQDHLGNEFKSVKEMADYYGVDYNKMLKGHKRGIDGKEALGG